MHAEHLDGVTRLRGWQFGMWAVVTGGAIQPPVPYAVAVEPRRWSIRPQTEEEALPASAVRLYNDAEGSLEAHLEAKLKQLLKQSLSTEKAGCDRRGRRLSERGLRAAACVEWCAAQPAAVFFAASRLRVRPFLLCHAKTRRPEGGRACDVACGGRRDVHIAHTDLLRLGHDGLTQINRQRGTYCEGPVLPEFIERIPEST